VYTRLTPKAELIGEEIYDEFDAENIQKLQTLYPVSSPQPSGDAPATLKSILKRNGSAPDLSSAAGSGDADRRGPARIGRSASTAAVHASGKGSGQSTPLLRPMAMPAMPSLPALKGLIPFGTRSRSTPPVPRDAPGSAGAVAASAHPEGTEAAGASVGTPVVGPVKFALPGGARISEEDGDAPGPPIVVDAVDATPPPLVLDAVPSAAGSTAQSSFATAPSEPGAEASPPTHSPTPSTPAAPAGVAALMSPFVPGAALPPSISSAAASRSASPAPSLEAFLLSKRRAPAAAAMKERTPSVGPKGTRFKSSPLTGAERMPALVAEEPKGARRADQDGALPDDDRTM
jgi:hypothetical protein